MTKTTEQKFLEAALKIFAEKGYKRTTTAAISKKPGFNKKTLFRNFKTKKNLYDLVLIRNGEKFIQEFMESINDEIKFESAADLLKNFIKNLDKVMFDNFEFFNLSINESSEILEPMMETAVNFIGKYIEKNIPNQNINYKVFGFTITSFIYTINLERYSGRTYISNDDTIRKFIENSIQCISIPKKAKSTS
jgi:AcrR family transcriptional regulator